MSGTNESILRAYNAIEDATPLSEDEADGLIPSHITTHPELNEWEQHNILQAEEWVFKQRRKKILNDAFIRRLHHKMFDSTWAWAGSYRKSDKNIGLPWYLIPEAVINACEDASVWVTNQTYGWDELAVRVHHRLVAIHPFPNGNGRHGRLFADAFLHGRGQTQFTWGRSDLTKLSDVRKRYISALKEADNGTFKPLIDFARS